MHDNVACGSNVQLDGVMTSTSRWLSAMMSCIKAALRRVEQTFSRPSDAELRRGAVDRVALLAVDVGSGFDSTPPSNRSRTMSTLGGERTVEVGRRGQRRTRDDDRRRVSTAMVTRRQRRGRSAAAGPNVTTHYTEKNCTQYSMLYKPTLKNSKN